MVRGENKYRFLQRHDLEQLALLKQMSADPGLSPIEALYTVTELVNHGFPEAAAIIRRVRERSRNVAALEYLDTLARRHVRIMALPERKRIFDDKSLMLKLYETGGYLYCPHESERDRLMVVFTTMYNNFDFSNAVLLCLLRDLGYSVLFLRDCTNCRYLKGVDGMGDDLRSMADRITQLARDNGHRRLFVTGFSSGGYASLFLTTLLQSDGYIGFAIESDFTSGLPAPQVRDGATQSGSKGSEIDSEFLCSLRTRIESGGFQTQRQIFAGDRADIDQKRIANLNGLPSCTIEIVPNCWHQVPGTLLERGQLEPLFASVGRSGS